MLSKILSQKGSALIYAMVGSLAVAGLALVLMQRAQIQKRITLKYKADSEVNIAVVEIASHLMTPQHCNATFSGVIRPTSLTQIDAIKQCTSGKCSTGTPSTVYIPVLNSTAMASINAEDRWKSFYTKFPKRNIALTGGESNIRLVGAAILLINSSRVLPYPGYPGEIRLDLTFEKKLVEAHVGGVPAHKISRVIRSIFLPVVTGSTISGVYTQSSTLQGCPKSPSSPAVY